MARSVAKWIWSGGGSFDHSSIRSADEVNDIAEAVENAIKGAISERQGDMQSAQV